MALPLLWRDQRQGGWLASLSVVRWPALVMKGSRWDHDGIGKGRGRKAGGEKGGRKMKRGDESVRELMREHESSRHIMLLHYV